MIKAILIVLFSNYIFASSAFEAATIEQKRKELSILKAEFEEYYKAQEEQLKHKLNTIELKEVLIKKKEDNIKKLLEEDKKLLKAIKMEIFDKTVKVYGYMKAKAVAKVFTQMISEHNIQKVYDIMIKLKSQQVVKILRKMSPKNSSLITQLMLKGEKPKLENKKLSKEK